MGTPAVYLIGPPGVGKSTLMEGLTGRYQTATPVKVPCPRGKTPLVYEYLYRPSPEGGDLAGARLGLTRPQFSGTDALGMSVNPQAVAWAEQLTPALEDFTIYGEGQRLANMPFLQALHETTDLTVLWLQAPETLLDLRCERRGSNQSPAWRKAAGTRVLNLASKLETAGVRLVAVDASVNRVKVLAAAEEALG